MIWNLKSKKKLSQAIFCGFQWISFSFACSKNKSAWNRFKPYQNRHLFIWCSFIKLVQNEKCSFGHGQYCRIVLRYTNNSTRKNPSAIHATSMVFTKNVIVTLIIYFSFKWIGMHACVSLSFHEFRSISYREPFLWKWFFFARVFKCIKMNRFFWLNQRQMQFRMRFNWQMF